MNVVLARLAAFRREAARRRAGRRTARALRDLPDRLRADLGLPRRGRDRRAETLWLR